MLYFLYGADKEKARGKARELISGLQKKKPDATLFRISSENFNVSQLDELLLGQGLFVSKSIIFFDGVFGEAEHKETVVLKLADIADSPNIFIFLEGKVDKPTLSQICKHTENVYKFGEESVEKSQKDYAFTDAFGARDKKKLWILFQKEIKKGKKSEELHGLLFWQIKSMILAEVSATPETAGLHPFVFSKNRQFVKNYGKGKLLKLLKDLAVLYHNAHRGATDFEIGLEHFLLSL